MRMIMILRLVLPPNMIIRTIQTSLAVWASLFAVTLTLDDSSWESLCFLFMFQCFKPALLGERDTVLKPYTVPTDIRNSLSDSTRHSLLVSPCPLYTFRLLLLQASKMISNLTGLPIQHMYTGTYLYIFAFA